MKVIKNTRSGVIHTRNCGNIKQMQKQNKHELEEVNPKKIEGKLLICKHCMTQKQAEKFIAWKYIHEKEKLEQKHQQKIRKEQQHYQNKIRKETQLRDKHLKQEHKNQLGRGLTKNTQNNYNHQVKQFIKWCIKKEQKTHPFPSHKKTHLTPTKIYKTLKDLKGE